MQKIWLMGIVGLMVGCQSASDPKSAANQLLQAMQKNDLASQKELSCSKTVANLSEVSAQLGNSGDPILTGIEKWEVTGVQGRTVEDDPDARYTTVFAKIQSQGTGVGSVNRTWEVDVWNSDERFEYRKRSVDKLNSMSQDIQRKTQAISPEIYNQVYSNPEDKALIPAPERSEVSSSPYCVLAIRPAQGSL